MTNRKIGLLLLVTILFSAGICKFVLWRTEFESMNRSFVLEFVGVRKSTEQSHLMDDFMDDSKQDMLHFTRSKKASRRDLEKSSGSNISQEIEQSEGSIPKFYSKFARKGEHAISHELEFCITPEMNGMAKFDCSADDLESTWGPLLQHNFEALGAEDLKSGEDTRSFAMRGILGECRAGCLNVSFEEHRAAYSDIILCNRLARNISNSRYCSPVIFHVFWGSPPVPPQVPLYILSFLTTQDLEYTKLWIWSRKGINLDHDPRLGPFVGHPNIEFQQFHGAEIMRTLNSTLIPESLFQAKDSQYWLESDLFRVLILHAFGGIYTDMDFLYLRSFGPILGQEWLYQWGSHCVDMNGAVMRLFPNSSLGRALIEHIVSVPPQAGTTAWGRDTYRAVSSHIRVLRYPSCFFNPSWLTGQNIYQGGTHRNSWYGAFGFHLHGGVFMKGPLAEVNSDYASVAQEMCIYCKLHHDGGLPRMSSSLLNQSFGIFC